MGKTKTGAYIPLPAVPLVLVGANVRGRPNYLPVGFVAGVNAEPAVVCVGLNKAHHTTAGILESGTFSLNVPPAGLVAEADFCGLVSGREADKSRLFTTFYGGLGTAPLIEECPVVCECRLVGPKVEFAMDTVFFGEVAQVYVDEGLLGPDGRVDAAKARPFVFCGLENRYRALGEELGSAWSAGKGLLKAL